MSIQERYDRLLGEDTDVRDHLPRFAELVKELNAQHVIELGVRSGVSTVAFLYALEETGGHLTSVDISPGPQIESSRWTFIQSDDLAPELLAQLWPAAIVFIDTSHHYEHTLAELRTYRPLVEPGGAILCHDTELEEPHLAPPTDPPFPVKTAITEFCDEEGLDWSNDPKCFGLAEIRIP